MGIFGPRFEKGALVERTDTGERGELTGDFHYGYAAVRWADRKSSWVREAMLRLVEVAQT